ncbi:MAG: T9SS type A sorting domain-containing protein [Lewinellaceae bacterium]|nr:T9SS type A sorting domain-containing protein [Lewinellaceae bacterium]
MACVFNTMGQLVETGQTRTGNFNLLLSGWETGFYFVEVITGHNRMAGKLVVHH